MSSTSPQSILLIVTGASRGLGKAVVKSFCRSAKEQLTHMHAVLLARSKEQLEQVRDELVSQTGDDDDVVIKVSIVQADLGNLETLEEVLDRFFDTLRNIILHDVHDDDDDEQQQWDHLVFVNNAGTVGPIGPCSHVPSSLSELQTALDLNTTSALWFSTRIVRFLQSQPATVFSKATLVNISSLVAVQPFPSMAVYSAGKAARNAYHTALAKELVSCSSNDDSNTISPTNISVLNYAPGPLETDMTEELRSSTGLDASLRPVFAQRLVDPMDSAGVLVQLILTQDYSSGDHVDYYDRIDS